jgi:hypothetical protein
MSWAPSRGLMLWLRGIRGGCSVRTTFSTTVLFIYWTPRLHDAGRMRTSVGAPGAPRLHDAGRARTSVGAPGAQGPLEWGSWGFNAARGRCSGQHRSK